jgi:hypothetical protein
MPAGRPTKYEERFCEEVVNCGKQGMSRAEMAAHFEVTRETLNEWAKAHAEFSDAVTRATEFSLAWWEQQGRENLKTASFQSALYGRAMSGRFPAEPYRERVEHTGKDGGPIDTRQTLDLSGLTPDQLRAIASIKLPAET